MPSRTAFLIIAFSLSTPATVVAADFVRGDVTAEGTIDVSDVIVLLEYLFLAGTAPDCMDAADTNDSGDLDISDPVFLLIWLFGACSQPPCPTPPPPTPAAAIYSVADCGPDPTVDTLECATFQACPPPPLPPPPVITTPTKKTNDATPIIEGTIAGSVAPNTTIHVFFDAAEDGTTTPSESGSWSYHNVSAAKNDGQYTVTARVESPQGIFSDFSEPIEITVDTTPPLPPTTLTGTPGQGKVLLEWEPSLSGSLGRFR